MILKNPRSWYYLSLNDGKKSINTFPENISNYIWCQKNFDQKRYNGFKVHGSEELSLWQIVAHPELFSSPFLQSKIQWFRIIASNNNRTQTKPALTARSEVADRTISSQCRNTK